MKIAINVSQKESNKNKNEVRCKIMKDILQDALARISKHDYIELRYRSANISSIQIVDGIVEEVSSGVLNGTGVRVLSNIHEAGTMALKGSSHIKNPAKLADVATCKGEYHAPFKKKLEDLSIEDKLELMTSASDWIKSMEKVATFTLVYNDQNQYIAFVNSEGSEYIRSSTKPTFFASIILADQGNIRPANRSYSKTCGAEFLDMHNPTDVAKEAYEEGMRLLKAKPAKGGMQNVVLSHEIVGLLAHEAIGHTAESDLVLAGSFLRDKLDEQVASELITLSDSPTVNDAVGWIPIDDEGVLGKKIEIIKDGVLKEYMVNRVDAERLGIDPTGNARAFTHRHYPIVRMRNTYIESGDMNKEELFEVIKEGFFLKGAMGGQADLNGEFMFGCREAIEIKDGKLTETSYVGPSISGNAFDVLKSVMGVGKTFVMDLGAGFCGKGQPAKVDAGGPLLACKALVGGQ
jgi:TldD protein